MTRILSFSQSPVFDLGTQGHKPIGQHLCLDVIASDELVKEIVLVIVRSLPGHVKSQPKAKPARKAKPAKPRAARRKSRSSATVAKP
jgi:hypothetical protein